eukprot:scaffold351_cov162-Ochromonas_danica.AAC.27
MGDRLEAEAEPAMDLEGVCGLRLAARSRRCSEEERLREGERRAAGGGERDSDCTRPRSTDSVAFRAVWSAKAVA